MKSWSSDVIAAVTARIAKRRNFVWLTAYRISDRAVQNIGFWDDIDTISASYIDVETGTTAGSPRSYTGAGSLMSIDDIPLNSDLAIRTINMSLSQLNDDVLGFVRQYDLKGAPIEVHRGVFIPGTYSLVGPLVPRFVGFIDGAPITDPIAGNDGKVELNCVSHTRLLTRTSTDVCSNESQQRRAVGDTFYKDMGVVGSWQVFWGETNGNIPAVKVGATSAGGKATTLVTQVK